MRIVVLNGNLLDTESMTIVGERHLVIEGDDIVEVAESPPSTGDADRVIDAAGRFLMPGFVDAHVHHVITTMDFPKLWRLSQIELALGMARLAEATVRRGFTSVRDAAGAVSGLVRAIDTGLCAGPRITRAGRALSQTGGHGDLGPSGDDAPTCACSINADFLGVVADGPVAVRVAARRELRAGSDFIKIMASGGVASPTDPLDNTQYTPDEIQAITTETDNRQTYTTAHAYTPEAVTQAIDNGVRCIEHGNLIDADTARRMAELDVTMVPTLVTYRAMTDLGEKAGLPSRNLDKNRGVFEAGPRSIELARAAGVELGFGTDLLGEAQPWQNREFAIRAELEPAVDVLRSMYHTNVRLCRAEGRIGRLVPGYAADIVVSNVDPIANLAGLAEPDSALHTVISRGAIIVDPPPRNLG